MDNQGVVFDELSAGRIVDVVRYVESLNKGVVPANGPRNLSFPAIILKTTSILSRRSSATPGSGTAKIQKFVSGTLSDLNTTNYTVYNMTASQIASGAYITCVTMYGHWWLLLPESCLVVS